VTLDDAPTVERPGPGGRDEGDERWYLTDQRDFLRRSMDDADREHDAGDLSDDDHALLIARDTARLADVDAELDALDARSEPSADGVAGAREAGETGASERSETLETAEPGRARLSPWRWAGIVAASLFIVLGVVILVVHFTQTRQPGQAVSGSVSLSQAQQIEQQLQQALTLNNQGNKGAALILYDKVLSEDPSNPAALAYAGYLQWNVGTGSHEESLVRIGRAEIQTAVKNAPSYYEAHLFYGLVLANQDHDNAAAVAQFNQFLADGPPAAELPQVASLVAPAYKALGQPLPAQFSSPSTTTSAP